MLTSIEVFSPRVSAPALAIGGGAASTDSIQIRDIQGLGPVKATINTTPLGSFDGELYSGSRIDKRNIVLTLGLNPNWATQSMAELRSTLYAYFMPKLWVRLRFSSTHMPDVEIEGYVEGFEPNLFSQDPEIDISIICPKPNFVAVDETSVTGTVKTDPTQTTTINYEGTIETGFFLRVKASALNLAFTGALTVRNVTQVEELITATTTITGNKHFLLNTVNGEKYVREMTGVVLNTNLLNTIPGVVVWPQLAPGVNKFLVLSVEADQDWELTYRAQYGGL